MTPPTVQEIADGLADALDRDRYHREGDPAGVWIASDRPVRRLGVRLEAGRPPYDWADGLDAVLVHRPFGLWPARLPPALGVIAVHRALDDRLALGPSVELAQALGLAPDEERLRRKGADIGLIGRTPPVPLPDVLARIDRQLGGAEDAVGPEPETVEAVALVGAMTDELIRQSAERGAALYVTGQIRRPGVAAAEQAGVRVLAVGQDRAEAWGLRQLGQTIESQWPDIEVVPLGLPAVGVG